MEARIIKLWTSSRRYGTLSGGILARGPTTKTNISSSISWFHLGNMRALLMTLAWYGFISPTKAPEDAKTQQIESW